MLTKVAVFKTDDGKLFADETEAVLHQSKLEFEAEVDAFMDSDANKYKSGVPRQFARAGILAWEAYKARKDTTV